ncbi:hypothetical protein BDV96DRAFT_617526 [Lophiotrema nucula]|uniref:Mediator complex subunit 15 KIX domain-containing protein n=1 Tax=Lophiotrema nucula TaxID=690887 RepID=A0A6A5YGQ9_9PLEO|nr:hypothetical protein BDV96DRAFT_617526 [Lophiotrema nucula]
MAMANRGNIQQKFMAHYRTQQSKAPPGWQQSVTPEERANYALQFYTQFRLAKPETQEMDAVRTSVTAESQTFMQSQTKDQYVGTMKQKFMQMAAVRQQRIGAMQNNMNNGMNPAQMGGMGQPGVPNQQRNPAQFPQGFPNPQLGRQMQASPIPMTQAQSSMGMNGANAMNLPQGNNTPQPNPAQQQQQQAQMQQQAQQQQQQQQQQQGGALDAQTLNALARRLMTTAKPEFMATMRQRVEQLPPEGRQRMMNQGVDPLFWCFRQHTEQLAKSGRIPVPTLQGLQAGNQQGQTQQPGHPAQVPNQQMNMSQQQQQGNQNFDLGALANQQFEALRVQDQGHTVVPASNNANGNQMGGFPGQNAQQGQPQNAALAQQRQAVAALQNANNQRLAQAQAQQHAQAQARAQQQLQQQQQQAQARNNANQMLLGQNGGLNLPAGTQQSPAMPMLTRPMVPPGQPATPQQRPQAHVPQMTPQGQPQADPQVMSQLMREAQQRAISTLQQGQPLTEQVRMSLLPAEMEPAMRNQLMRVPDQNFRQILTTYLAGIRNRNNQQIQNMPGAQQQAGQPNMMMNPQAQAIQMNMQNQLMNGGNLGNMGRAPGMPPVGQPTPNGMAAQQGAAQRQPQQLNQQQKLMMAQSTLQQNPGIIAATDDRPFPPGLLSPQARQSLPPDLRTWAQLKQWANQNPHLFPNMDAHRLLLLQVLHFQDYMRQQSLQQNQNNAAAQRLGLPQQQGTGAVTPQGVQAPGQPPIRTPVPQVNMGNIPGGQIIVTPQEIAAFRQRLPPQQQGSTPDDQLRNYLMQQKLTQRRQQAPMMNMQQRNQAQQPQPPMPGQPPQVSRPPTTQPQPAQAAPQPKPTPKPQPQPAQKPAQPNAQNNLNKGVKRPNDDGAEAASAENAAPNAAPPAPAMVPSRSQQGVPNLTQEQLSRLNPQQREQLLKAQAASNLPNKPQQRGLPSHEEVTAKMREPAQQVKFKTMLMEEEKKLQNHPVVQVGPEARAQLQQLLREKQKALAKVEMCLRLFVAAYEGSESEAVARSVMGYRSRLLKQISGSDMTLNESLTMSEVEITNAVKQVLAFVAKVMARFQNQGQPNAAQQNQQQSQSEQSVRQQLTPANLKQHEQEQKRQQKAPQAPTTDRPPFPLGGQSPRGAPTYFEPPKIGNLVLPDKKKQKLDSTTSTPGQKPSPRIPSGKTGSPEVKRQPVLEKPVEQKPKFRCQVPDCDPNHRGFDTQGELEAHVKDVHAKIEDPLSFALESMADYLEVDPRTGLPKSDAATARPMKPTPSGRRASQPIKAGQTPSMAQNVTTPAGAQAVTPMARVPTQTGVKSSPSAKILKTPQTGIKAGTPSAGMPAKATPTSVTKAATKELEPVVVPEPEKELENQPFVPTSLFDYSYDDIYAALDTSGTFTVLDLKDEDNSWALRSRPSSPINTPDSSSKDTPETRQSDISENDNLQIDVHFKDIEVPDGWLAALAGDPVPLDVQLSEDISTLGVTLPPMDNDDMMLFYGDNLMMDLDAMDAKYLDGPTLDPSLLGP